MKPLHSKLVLGGAMLGLVLAATGFERCPQVVGFARGGAEAHGVQWLPTHGGETAMNGAPSVSFHAVSVVYKSSQTRQMPIAVHVLHQALPSQAIPPQSVGHDGGDVVQRPADRSEGGAARMVQTMAHVSGTRNQSRMVSDTEPAQPPSVVTQLVVVTAWQNGRATRVVFTTMQTAGAAGQPEAAEPGATTGEQTAPAEPGPRYAAVPVRGGWLIFQL